MGQPPKGVREWNVEDLAAGSTRSDSQICPANIPARRPFAKLEKRLVKPEQIERGDYLYPQHDRRWYLVLDRADSAYGRGWLCVDARIDGPPSRIAWHEVEYVGQAKR